MKISSNLIQLTDKVAVCSVTIKDENTDVCIYATALAAETSFYADLAQKRALDLAWKCVQEGISAAALTLLPVANNKAIIPMEIPPQAANMPPVVTNIVENVSKETAPLASDNALPILNDEIPWGDE